MQDLQKSKKTEKPSLQDDGFVCLCEKLKSREKFFSAFLFVLIFFSFSLHFFSSKIKYNKFRGLL